MPDSDPRSILGRTIRQLREEQDLSQEELAYRCGLHRTYVGSVERGERNISLLNIVAIAHTLKVLPVRLLQDIH